MSNAVHHPASAKRQTSLREMRSTSGGVMVASLIFAALLSACGKSEKKSPVVEAKPAAKAPAAPVKTAGGETDPLTASREAERSEEDLALERQADDIMAAHPNMTAQELLNVPEVNTKLAGFLKSLSQSPELQSRVNNSIAFAATMKNLQGPKENWQFSMDLKGYDKPRTQRLLTSILSEKPSRVVDFFEHEVSQASVEFTFDPNSKQASNGISLEPKPAPAPMEQ